jgi:bifunctional non-homologous end joining protein LigD
MGKACPHHHGGFLMGTNREVALAYREGNSDKVYNVGIYTKDMGFVVDFQYGRRGAILQTGTKTAGPVKLETAVAIFDKLVKEKMAKGYSPGEAGIPYQHTDQEQRATGIFPQLLNSVEENDLPALIKNDAFYAQEKHDGKRVMIRVGADGSVTGINRTGLTIGLPQPIVDAARKLGKDFTLDGECVGDVFYAFDLLDHEGTDCRPSPYSDRHWLLQKIVASYAVDAIRLVDTALTRAGKEAMLKGLRANNREGIVFKNCKAAYKPGRPASGGPQLKFKFVATASCLVVNVNPGKRSVSLELMQGTQLVGVGNVTIPPNYPVPEPGGIVEVRYLYAHKGGSLYQPVYLGVRDDLTDDACQLSQLKYKSEDTDDET